MFKMFSNWNPTLDLEGPKKQFNPASRFLERRSLHSKSPAGAAGVSLCHFQFREHGGLIFTPLSLSLLKESPTSLIILFKLQSIPTDQGPPAGSFNQTKWKQLLSETLGAAGLLTSAVPGQMYTELSICLELTPHVLAAISYTGPLSTGSCHPCRPPPFL